MVEEPSLPVIEEEPREVEEELPVVVEPPPVPKVKRTRPPPEPEPEPSESPEPKRRPGRPPKAVDAPKAKYTPRKPRAPPVYVPTLAPPSPAASPVNDQDLRAMTRFMVNRLGSASRDALEHRQNKWRNMVASNYT